jgi:predicted amidohydrolase YtcJ
MQRLKQTRYVSAFAYNVWPASLPARTVTTMTSNKLLPARPLLFSALACSFLLSACSSEESTVASPDLIVINADVHTVDSTVSRADAFAVTGGRFVAVGDTTKIRPMAGEDTVIIDAGGVSIIPGLIDGHTHLIGGAGLATGVDLSEIEDKDEWLRIIREKADSLPAGAWILGGAWNHNLSDGILPTKEMLDSVAPENPVLLRDIDFHSSWANTLAIELAGISADSEVPPGGEILLDPATGEATGIFLEGAMRLFNGAPGLADARDPVAGARAAMRMANSLGITSAHDMSGNLDAFLEVFADGDLTMRIWEGVFAGPSDDLDQHFADLNAERERVRDIVAADAQSEKMGTLFQVGYVKMMIDGVLSTHTAMMKAPYSDNPDATVQPFIQKDHLDEMVSAAHAAGFPVAVHAIGDEGVSWVLDAFEGSPRSPGMPMDRIEHIEVVTPDDVARFASLGIAASMQPHHATCCVGDYVIDRIGRDRLPNAYVWRQMLDTDNHLVLGSDWATSPLNPLIQIADTLHRETRIDGVVRPWDEGNTLTFAEALHGYTQAGADMTPWAGEIGSISVGKWADFVILDERLPAEIDRSIENRKVTATYLAGEQVYP